MSESPTPRQILVVDDDPLWRQVLQRRLTNAGYVVECAANGRHALDWLHATPILPALILTDLMMPEADGYDLCTGVRHDPRLAHLPIILISSVEAPDLPPTDEDFHLACHLTKPVPAETILATIKALLPAGATSAARDSTTQPYSL